MSIYLTYDELMEENKQLRARYKAQCEYSIDLARIIESLCSGGEIVEPQTNARFHYEMAIKAKQQKLEKARQLKLAAPATQKE